MKTKEVKVKMPAGLLIRAELMMEADLFNDVSGYIQQLIRAEWARLAGPNVYTPEQEAQILASRRAALAKVITHHNGDSSPPP